MSHIIGSQDIIQSPFIQIAFTVQGKTEHGVKKKELDSVSDDRPSWSLNSRTLPVGGAECGV
jgi:hypothetical protein